MERTFKSQSQLPQRRWTLAGDAKPPTSNGRCTSAKSSTLPKIANRPMTALPPYRTPSGHLATTNLERKAPAFPRERPKSALVRPLSGRISLRSAHPEWQANGSGSSKTSMLRLEDFSDGEDDTLEEEEDTALQDLLTCSALNVEAKARKPDWNISDPVTPIFHCPRCRDHWYGFTSLPCDEVRARLARGVWHMGQEGITRGEGKLKVTYRSKSARVRHTDGEKQDGHQPINGDKGPSKNSDQTGPSEPARRPLNRESPPLKAHRQIGFRATKDNIEDDGRAVSSITNHSREGDRGGIGDGDGGGTAHQSGHDVTDKGVPQSESPDQCDNVVTALEGPTRLQSPTNTSPWRCNEAPPLNVNGYRNITEGGQDGVAIVEDHRNDKTAPTDCFAVNKEKGQLSTSNVSPAVANVPITALNDDHRSGQLRTKVVDIQDSVPPTNQVTPMNHTPLDHTKEITPPPSEQHSSKNMPPASFSTPTINHPSTIPPRSRSDQRSEPTARPFQDMRSQGDPLVPPIGPLVPPIGPLVPPIPPRRHTGDVSELIYGFKLTSPWTFSYHAPASPPKKASMEHRSR